MLSKKAKMERREARVKRQNLLFFGFCFFLVLGCSFCWAGEQLDRSKYISIEEIRPGMEAYCLTGYRGAEIEKFGLEVLDVVRNILPGRDAILVQGTDERFIHTGPVAGCSGSPVYIDGRLAGALAFAWFFSKDPLYGVTPIREMLRVGEKTQSIKQGAWEQGFVLDFSVPIDFAEIDKQLSESRYLKLGSRLGIQRRTSGLKRLPCPLIISGLPADVCEQLGGLVEPFGLMAVAGIGGGGSSLESRGMGRGSREAKLVPGACLVVPLVTGDITMEVVGTATEVVGDKVYGFGHSFLGYGPIDLPMAVGEVHAVVSSVFRSFKFASAVEIVGALTRDESPAVYGQIGAKARMIPLTIRVDRYNDAEKRLYNCRVANNRLLTPVILRLALGGAALVLGRLPPDHTLKYKVAIGVEGAESVSFENVSTSLGLDEMIIESVVSVAILMNNPYKKIDIKSIEVEVRIVPRNVVSHIWSVDLSDTRIKAGEEVKIGVVVESFLAEKKKYEGSLKIPDELAPGKYDLIVCGGYGYEKFLRKVAPYRFVPQNLSSLIGAINNILAVKRDKLYCLLVLPAGGVAVEKAELPDLPATKVLVLQDAKRTLEIRPYQHWVEESFRTGTVIIDKKVMRVTVEK
jgi:hypothetical protein